MVVLQPTLKDECIRTCRCGHLGLMSPIRQRSSFGRLAPGVFQNTCLRCNGKRTATCGERLPAQPFHAWIRSLLAERKRSGDQGSTKEEVAHGLGVSAKRLDVWLTLQTIDHSVVDRATALHGGVTVEDVYRVFGNGTYIKTLPDDAFAFVVYYPVVKRAWGIRDYQKEESVGSTVRVKRCRWGGERCEESPVEGKRFCAQHAAILGGVRTQVENRSKEFRSTIKKKGSRSTCCRPGCDNPRLQLEAYCDDCYAAGWREEDRE